MPSVLRHLACCAAFALAALSVAGAALDLSQPEAAEPELRLLVEEWETAGAADPSPASKTGLAHSLHALGLVQRQQGKAADALAQFDRALALLKDAASPVTDVLEAKALTLQDLGRFAEAEKLLREVLEMRSRGDDAALRAVALDHLALNLLLQGRYHASASLFQEALAIVPADQPALRARLLAHTARLHHTLGSHHRAVGLAREALDLRPADPELVLAIESQLALSRLRLGEAGAARTGFEMAAAKARELYGPRRPLEAVPHLNNLGAVSLAEGRADEAVAIFREAVELITRNLGPDHPSLVAALNNLGVALQATGAYPEAERSLVRASELQSIHLPRLHLRVAETSRNLARNSLLRGSADAPGRIQEATDLTLALLEEMVGQGSERERLNFIERSDPLSLPCGAGDAALIADTLLAAKARLLDALLGDDSTLAPPRWRDVVAALPPDSALVDFCRFNDPLDRSRAHHGAIVLSPDQAPRWVRLGSEADLRPWLDALHRRLAWKAADLAGVEATPPPLKLPTILRALHSRLWAPVEAALPEETRHLALAPDAALHFVPWCALVDSAGEPLCRRYPLAVTVASGRDLLKPPPAATLRSAPWTLLSVSGFPRAEKPSDPTPLDAVLAELGAMPGSAREARILQRLAPPGTRWFQDQDASEARLKTLTSTGPVLHLSSHAFFIPTEIPGGSMPLDFDARSDLFISSGLVLHEGTRYREAADGEEDDLVFPEEIARLDLKATRLVTLSSCESGVGTPLRSEGLLGLQRAFVLAGARETVVSLWPVSDVSTPAFMRRFYQLALESDHPAHALWRTQAELLTSTEDADFESSILRYAPFVLSQSAALQAPPNSVAPPPSPQAGNRPWLLTLAGFALLAFVIARRIRKATSTSQA